MTNKTRKRIWPVSLVMAIAFIGAVAAIVAIAALPGTASAQPAPPTAPGTTPTPGGGPPPPPPPPDTGNGDMMVGANAPSAPMNVRSEVLDNMILVRWDKPEPIGPAGAEISRYVITRVAYTMDANSPINESGGKTMMVGSTVREYRDQGLGYNTTYSHTVKAVNMYTIDGEKGSSTGPDSAPVTKTTASSGGLLMPELAPPGAPTALKARGSCDDQISVTWEAPADAGKVAPDTVGCPVCADQTPAHTGGTNAGIQVKPGTALIVNYMVERSVDGAAWQVLTNKHTSLEYIDRANLGYGKTYAYRVTAMNNALRYGESAKAAETLAEPPVPNVPQSPDADLHAEDASKVLFTWDPPPGDWRNINDINAIDNKNLSRSLKYHVERRLEGTGDWKRLTVDASGNNDPQVHEYLNNVTKAEALRNIQTQAYQDEDIPKSGSYKYRVAALIDGCLLSAWVVTAREVVVTLDLGPPSDLKATTGAVPGTVLLSWMSGPNSTEHWVAGIKQSDWDAGNYSNVIFTSAQSNSSYSITGLDSGAEYVFAVSAGRGGAWSDWTPLTKVTPN